MEFVRECGVLLHPTSLPGRYGIGELGEEAYRFADRLVEMGQHLWQILPLGPTSYGDSPYQSLSTFAGNHLLISFDELVRDGLLAPSRLKRFPRFSDDRVDYGEVIPAREAVLIGVCRGFNRRASAEIKEAFEAFCRENAEWLDDYALYVAIKDAHGGRPWPEWEETLASRDPAAMQQAGRTHRTAIRNVRILQFLFALQWNRLRDYCHQRSIRIVGDIPIFVAHDSADVWAHRDLFYIDDTGQPAVIAGVPPDYFSVTGQRWGNPLYRWDLHQADDFRWWVERMRKVFDRFDIVRIDHFRGFEAYWEIPGHEPTAIHGRWVPGPGEGIFHALRKELGDLPIIAEDLGVITPPVEALRDQFTFPGMRVLQFSFGGDATDVGDRPEAFPPNSVCYTGTHDNDTTLGWFWSNAGEDTTRSQEDIDAERRRVLDYLGTDGSEIHWDLAQVAIASPSNSAVIPLQDLLGLGSEARMNVPGRPGGNWQWRFHWTMLTPKIIGRLHALCEAAHRIHP